MNHILLNIRSSIPCAEAQADAEAANEEERDVFKEAYQAAIWVQFFLSDYGLAEKPIPKQYWELRLEMSLLKMQRLREAQQVYQLLHLVRQGPDAQFS